jgi:hypothetical protein
MIRHSSDESPIRPSSSSIAQEAVEKYEVVHTQKKLKSLREGDVARIGVVGNARHAIYMHAPPPSLMALLYHDRDKLGSVAIRPDESVALIAAAWVGSSDRVEKLVTVLALAIMLLGWLMLLRFPFVPLWLVVLLHRLGERRRQ